MIVRICWGATAGIAAFGLLTFANDLSNAESAPQQAAAAAMAVAWVVMPYVFTRAMEGLFPPKAAAVSKKSKASSSTSAGDVAAGQF
jgi:hypothetical protein